MQNEIPAATWGAARGPAAGRVSSMPRERVALLGFRV